MGIDDDRAFPVGARLPIAPALEAKRERSCLGRLELEHLLTRRTSRALPRRQVVFTAEPDRLRELGGAPQIAPRPGVGADDQKRLAPLTGPRNARRDRA